MAIIRIDIVTDKGNVHEVVTSEEKACEVVNNYMQSKGISDCTMVSKEDMLAVNAEIADFFNDPTNFENYAEWHDIESDVKNAICEHINNELCDDENIVKVAEILGIDMNEIFEGENIDVVKQHFCDVLKLANAELIQDGLQIVLKNDDEMFWSVGIKINATNETKWYYMSDFKYEVREHIFDCWERARSLKHSLKKGKADDKLNAIIEAAKNQTFADEINDIDTLSYTKMNDKGEKEIIEERFDHIDTTTNPISVHFICGTGYVNYSVPIERLTDESINKLYECIENK